MFLIKIFYFIGLFVNEALNYVLKNLIKESRPDARSKLLFCCFFGDSVSNSLSILLRILGVSTHVGTFTKHGMPSDHAQTIFYFMTFISLVVIFRFTLSLHHPPPFF